MTSFGRKKAVRLAGALALATSTATLAGCMSSPTYGTGKTANAQLLEDVTGMLNPVAKPSPAIDYKPRPEIVTPATEDATQVAGLPAPQDKVATSSNPAWPESPEQRRARIRAEATANRDTVDFEPEVELDTTNKGIISSAREDRGNAAASGNSNDIKARGAEFQRRKLETQQGSPTTRKYLSEPPLEYRAPAETAATGELGEDEYKKDARRKRESRKKGGKSSWSDIIPWL